MVRDLYIGIDGGTGSLRAGLYDRAGRPLGAAAAPYGTLRPHNGWAEQRPEDWWAALKEAIAALLRRTGASPGRIRALSLATTCCSVVLCSRAGKPVRDSIIWMDVRAFAEAEEIARRTGERLSAEWMPCKLLWLKRHEPQQFDRAEVFCEYQDWMTWKLTGKWSVNVNTACNWGYNRREGGFPLDFYKRIGLAEAVGKFPADHVYAVGDPIGTLAPAAAAQLGLDARTLVAQGGVDSSVGLLGMGVCRRGDAALMTGSSNLLMMLTDRAMFTEEATVTAGPDHLIPGLYTGYRGQVSAGSILEWFRREFCRDLPEDSAFDTLNAEAAKLPVGSDGLLALDYWQGNRHPYYDTRVRGMVYGYSLSHTRAHVYRALMEGIAYGVENLFRQFREGGLPVERISLSGGSANSPLFVQIYADVSGVGIRIPEEKQAVCLGGAVAAAAACGEYPGLPEAVDAMVRFDRTVEPDAGRHAQYAALFRQYAEIYPAFKDWMHRTADVFLQIDSRGGDS